MPGCGTATGVRRSEAVMLRTGARLYGWLHLISRWCEPGAAL